MNIVLSPKIEHDAELSALVSHANLVVERVVGEANVTATASWDLLTNGRQRPVLTLRLQDQLDGQCEGGFAPDELRNEGHLASRLNELNGAMIQVGQWRGQLRQLFERVKEWCQTLPGVYVTEEPITVRESPSGEYATSRLIIAENGQTMMIEPVAKWVVGADGRVDLRGAGGPITLLYSQHDQQWNWLQDRPPWPLVPLNKDLFLGLVKACLYG